MLFSDQIFFFRLAPLTIGQKEWGGGDFYRLFTVVDSNRPDSDFLVARLSTVFGPGNSAAGLVGKSIKNGPARKAVRKHSYVESLSNGKQAGTQATSHDMARLFCTTTSPNNISREQLSFSSILFYDNHHSLFELTPQKKRSLLTKQSTYVFIIRDFFFLFENWKEKKGAWLGE